MFNDAFPLPDYPFVRPNPHVFDRQAGIIIAVRKVLLGYRDLMAPPPCFPRAFADAVFAGFPVVEHSLPGGFLN
jgi:hypothetical protein